MFVPSFSGGGYVLAGAERDFRLPSRVDVPTRFLDAAEMAQTFRFSVVMARREVEPNYLNNQKLVAYFEQDWANVMR